MYTCRHQNIRRVSGDTVHHTSLRSVFIMLPFSERSSCRGLCTRHPRGTGSPRLQIFGRSKRCGFCPPDLPDFDKLSEQADDRLFERTLNNPYHTLHRLLPPNRHHHRTITSDAPPTTNKFMHHKDIRVTVILLRGYCTQINTNSKMNIVYCKL